MSENSDALIMVVSEETGAISLAYDSRIYYDLSTIEVQRKLKEFLSRESKSPDTEQKETAGAQVKETQK
jgi:diadenylate cyclase